MIADRFVQRPVCAILFCHNIIGVPSEMRVGTNQTQELSFEDECTEKKRLKMTTNNSRLQKLDDTWDVANRWISQNAAMSLLIAATLGATWGWIQKRSP